MVQYKSIPEIDLKVEINIYHFPWGHSFESISPLWPPLLDKTVKLSFYTSPQTPSLRFDLPQLYREAERLASGIS